VLLSVHVVIAVHIVQWLIHGATLSPVEPSEGMELAKHDVVNTGLVFFVVAIVLTAVFGRFFCGWGCHLIALQDLSRWLMIKLGVRPRPLRSRLLGWVPVVAAGYMFVWPALYRAAAGERFGPLRARFLTEDFWVTFPGLAVALVTFAVCGFAIVVVLGAKGFCAYGCPYGAFFGAADRLAPVRVRVTDACRGCATCTGVCTSNVRVHEEVREFGMVVDPGCMKCLDCVSSCPNGALYVGAGRPSVGRRRRRRRPPGTLRWSEEVVAAVVFVAGFVVFRGLYRAVPFLLALGLAATLAGIAVVGWRLARRADVWLASVRVKADGRLRPSGRAVAVIVGLAAVVWCHSAWLRVLEHRADERYRATASLRHAALDLDWSPRAINADTRSAIRAARASLEAVDRVSPFGSPDRELGLAWMLYLDGDREHAVTRLQRALESDPGNPESHLLAARLLVADNRIDRALGAFARASELDPGDPAGFLGRGALLAGRGRFVEAEAVFDAGLAANPGSIDLRYNLGLNRALRGDVDGAIEAFEAVLAADPGHTPARENLAGALAAAGRYQESVVRFEEAIERSPSDPQLRLLAARACLAAGRRAQAERHIEAAIRLDPAFASARRMLD
jgi:tetratricopeptide (TPR) repeat protein/Fe-S-cluster-containing hydrogenase component 2